MTPDEYLGAWLDAVYGTSGEIERRQRYHLDDHQLALVALLGSRAQPFLRYATGGNQQVAS